MPVHANGCGMACWYSETEVIITKIIAVSAIKMTFRYK